MTDRIKEQIQAIANSGEANLLDTDMVHLIAEREEYNELKEFIEENMAGYIQFINNCDFK